MSTMIAKALFADEYLRTARGGGEKTPIRGIDTGGRGPFHLYGLDDVYLFANGMAMGQDGVVIRDSIIRDQHIDALAEQLFAGKDTLDFHYRRLPGQYCSLLGPWADGFWHWMMEYLTKLVIAEVHGFQGTYIIPQAKAPFILESLRLVGVPEERIIRYDADDPVLIERLYLPERFTAESGAAYLSILTHLRGALLRGAPPAEGAPRRIYISRQLAGNGRRVVNERELTALLGEFGFESVLMEQRTLAEQVHMMAGAEWLVGAHGAGMFHALMMPESSCVMELFSPNYANVCMIGAVELLHHSYYMISSNFVGSYAFGSDIDAPLRLIRSTIGNHLHNRGRGTSPPLTRTP